MKAMYIFSVMVTFFSVNSSLAKNIDGISAKPRAIFTKYAPKNQNSKSCPAEIGTSLESLANSKELPPLCSEDWRSRLDNQVIKDGVDLLLVGDSHIASQQPQQFLNLLQFLSKQNRIGTVILEIGTDLVPAFENFVLDNEAAPNSQVEERYFRSFFPNSLHANPGFLEMIRFVRVLKRDHKFQLCFPDTPVAQREGLVIRDELAVKFDAAVRRATGKSLAQLSAEGVPARISRMARELSIASNILDCLSGNKKGEGLAIAFYGRAHTETQPIESVREFMPFNFRQLLQYIDPNLNVKGLNITPLGIDSPFPIFHIDAVNALAAKRNCSFLLVLEDFHSCSQLSVITKPISNQQIGENDYLWFGPLGKQWNFEDYKFRDQNDLGNLTH